MSALRQPGPQAVHPRRQASNTISNTDLSSLANDATSRYTQERPGISSHLSLGDTGYQTLKSRSTRLILDDIDELFGISGDCGCCQARGAHEMSSELDNIARMEQLRTCRR